VIEAVCCSKRASTRASRRKYLEHFANPYYKSSSCQLLPSASFAFPLLVRPLTLLLSTLRHTVCVSPSTIIFFYGTRSIDQQTRVLAILEAPLTLCWHYFSFLLFGRHDTSINRTYLPFLQLSARRLLILSSDLFKAQHTSQTPLQQSRNRQGLGLAHFQTISRSLSSVVTATCVLTTVLHSAPISSKSLLNIQRNGASMQAKRRSSQLCEEDCQYKNPVAQVSAQRDANSKNTTFSTHLRPSEEESHEDPHSLQIPLCEHQP
jgi:hypothetical protein